jgi:hypothetical protein
MVLQGTVPAVNIFVALASDIPLICSSTRFGLYVKSVGFREMWQPGILTCKQLPQLYDNPHLQQAGCLSWPCKYFSIGYVCGLEANIPQAGTGAWGHLDPQQVLLRSQSHHCFAPGLLESFLMIGLSEKGVILAQGDQQRLLSLRLDSSSEISSGGGGAICEGRHRDPGLAQTRTHVTSNFRK